MTRRFAAICLALALLWSVPASAFDTPATDPAVKDKIGVKGTTYQPYGKMLGYTEFAWGNLTINGTLYTLKYLQPKDTLETAKSMMIVTVYELSGDKDKDDAKMASTIAMLQGFYGKSATMVDNKVLTNNLDEKIWFTQFYSGPEDAQIYTAGSYLRTGTHPSEAAFVQLQSHSAIPPEKALTVYQLVNNEAVLPVKKKKPGFDPLAPITPEPVSIAK